jgi:probable O-glycosylation ligase (exosortase A-associated)
MRDLAFMAFFVAYLPAVIRYPHIGAMLWAWLSFCSPEEYLFGFMTVLPLSKIVAILTLAALALQRDARRPYIDGVMAMMLALVAVGLISATFSLTPLAINWYLFGKLGKIVVLCFVVTMVITTRRRLQGLILATALGLAFNGADEGLKVLLTAGGHHVLGVATMGDNNSFALAMLMCMPILLYLYQTSAHPFTRFVLMTGEVLCGIAVVGTYSRGGFLGLVTFALGLIALNRNKLRNFVMVAISGLILLQFAPATWFQRIDSISTAGTDTSFMDRVTAWKVSILMALDRPFFGGGFHAVQDTSVYLHYGKDLARLSFIPGAPLREFGMAAHSIYFEVLGDLGFVGLALFMAMLVLAIASCSTIRRRAKSQPDMGWMAELAGMLRLSLIVYLVSGAALSFAYFEGVYLLVAMLSVTRHMQSVELARRATAPPEPEEVVGIVSGPPPVEQWVPVWEQFGEANAS